MDKFDLPEPKKVAPDLTSEQRATLAPLDLMVQYIMPKLIDKQNRLEWETKRELFEIRRLIGQLGEDYQVQLATLGNRIAALEKGEGNLVATLKAVHDKPREKKAGKSAPQKSASVQDTLAANASINNPVAMSSVAEYDPDTDEWVPKVFGDVKVTRSVVRDIKSGDTDYPADVVGFVLDLSDDAVNVLCDIFPE